VIAVTITSHRAPRAKAIGFFGADQVRQLADLPSKEVLLAQLLGTLQTPIAQLVGTIQAPVQTLVGLLEAYKNKLEAA